MLTYIYKTANTQDFYYCSHSLPFLLNGTQDRLYMIPMKSHIQELTTPRPEQFQQQELS